MEDHKLVPVVLNGDPSLDLVADVPSIGEKSEDDEVCGASFVASGVVNSISGEEDELADGIVSVLETDDQIVVDSVCNNSPVDSADVEVVADASLKVTRCNSTKRKRGRPPKFQVKVHAKKPKDEEDVCFICFDGGTLVLCDRRGCPKAYHPACIKRDDAFFRSKAKWNCGWHICSKCEKASFYICFTCTYSLCRMCVKDAEFLCVRGSMGFCPTCMKTIMLIENKVEGDNEMVKVDFDDKSSWEYLFKVYWIYMKEKFRLTVDELTNAKNPWKGDVMPLKVVTSVKYPERIVAGKGILKRHSMPPKLVEPKAQKYMREAGANMRFPITSDATWASKDLLEFLSKVRNGDTNIISPFDVQALLLEYIKRNNLRDPRCKSQIICDALLRKLFHKKRVGHFEMLKLLDYHFSVKDDACTSGVVPEGKNLYAGDHQTAADGSSDNQLKICKERKQKKNRRDIRGPKTNSLDEEEDAAIDVHNVSLIYLKRNLVEKLIGDDEKFCQNVVGAAVRIKISSCELKDDLYRLVQVIGVHKVTAPYKVGQKSTNLLLEILNLDKKEIISIDTISNQEFTEEYNGENTSRQKIKSSAANDNYSYCGGLGVNECKRLYQTKRSGLLNWMTMGQLRKKAMILQTLKMSDWLEAEIMRLGHLRDLANEKGHKKEFAKNNAPSPLFKLKDCVEKLERLNTREGRQLLMNRIPEVHSESTSMGSDDEFDENPQTPSSKKLAALHSVPICTDKKVVPESEPKTVTQFMYHYKPGEPEEISTQVDTEFEKKWHYRDPNGKVQGPFDVLQLRKWNTTGYFPPDLRIWRETEAENQSVLLTRVLDICREEDGGEKSLNSTPLILLPPSSNRREGGENWNGKSMEMDLNSLNNNPHEPASTSNNCSGDSSGVCEFQTPSSPSPAALDFIPEYDPPTPNKSPDFEQQKSTLDETVSRVDTESQMEQALSDADRPIEDRAKATADNHPTAEEMKESDASVQSSSLTNCSPLNMCSSTEGGWDLLSTMAKSPSCDLHENVGKWPADAVQQLGLNWSGDGGGAHVPEIIIRWAGFSETPIGGWASELVTGPMGDKHLSAESAREQMTRPVESTAGWQAIVTGEEESVSDLLAEVDAMESRGLPSPTSMMKSEEFGRGLKDDCFGPIEILSRRLDPGGKSDRFSSTEEIQLDLSCSMGGGGHRFSCIEFLDTKCSDVSVNQRETVEIPPPAESAWVEAEGLNLSWGQEDGGMQWGTTEQQQQQQGVNMNWGISVGGHELWGNTVKPGGGRRS